MKFETLFCSVLAVLVSAVGVTADEGGLRQESDHKLDACEQVCIDFSMAGNGTTLKHSDYVKNEWHDAFGMTVEASTTMGGHTPDGMARIYDTTQHGEVPNLASPNEKCGGHGVGAGGEPEGSGPNCNPGGEGNVLIIQESDKPEPDDNVQGGIIKFTFDCPVYKLRSISLMDVETGEQAFFEIYNDGGGAPTIQKIAGKGGNSIQKERFDGGKVKNITRVDVVASNSFGVRSICFCPSPYCLDSSSRIGPSLSLPPATTTGCSSYELFNKVTNTPLQGSCNAYDQLYKDLCPPPAKKSKDFPKPRYLPPGGKSSCKGYCCGSWGSGGTCPKSWQKTRPRRHAFPGVIVPECDGKEEPDECEVVLVRKNNADWPDAACSVSEGNWIFPSITCWTGNDLTSEIRIGLNTKVTLCRHAPNCRGGGTEYIRTESGGPESVTFGGLTELYIECMKLPETCDPVIVDFDSAANGTMLPAGTYLKDEWHIYGLSLSAEGGVNKLPSLFDTADPGTLKAGDPDLGAPNERCPGGGPGTGTAGEPGKPGENCAPLGNVLIIQEMNDTPYTSDDNVSDGIITLDFLEAGGQYVYEIGLLDIDFETAVIVEYETGSGELAKFVIAVDLLGENSLQTVQINQSNVRRIKVMMENSGAVTFIRFCPKVDANEVFPIRNADLKVAIDHWYETVVSILERSQIMKQSIPHLRGVSIDSAVGGQYGSVAGLLDLGNFVSSADVISSRQLQSELTTVLKERGSIVPIDSQEAITVETDNGETKIVISATIVPHQDDTSFKTIALKDLGLFDEFDSCQSVQIETNATVDVSVGLAIKASLMIGADGRNPEVDGKIIASVNFSGDPVTLKLSLGLLELNCTANAAASTNFTFTLCKGSEKGCNENEIIGEPLEGGSKLFLVVSRAEYSLEGTCKLGVEFPGVKLKGGSTTFKITDRDAYAPDPQVTLTGLDFDPFLSFSPCDALSLLRTISSALTRVRANQALQQNLPLTKEKFSNVLTNTAESILEDQLLKLFLKTQDFDKRPTKSLFLDAIQSLDSISTAQTMKNKEIEFYIVTEDLNVNLNDEIGIRNLARANKGMCTFVLPKDPKTDAEFAALLRDGISTDESCAVKACQKTDCALDKSTGDFFGCDVECDVVVDVDEDSKESLVFIATVAYSDTEKQLSKDVQLIGLYEPHTNETNIPSSLPEIDNETSLHEIFPFNLPVTPALIPRFRNFNDLFVKVETALSNNGFEAIDVSYTYVENGNGPSRFDIILEFESNASFGNVSLDASAGIGDLAEINVEESSLAGLATAKYRAKFSVILAPNLNEDIILIGNACNGTGFICDSESVPMTMKLEYFGKNSVESVPLNLDPGGNASDALSTALKGIAHVKELQKSLLLIRFDPSISSIELLVPKICINAETDELIDGGNAMLECSADQKKTYLYNDFGLQDQNLTRRQFQIAVGQISINAGFDVSGSAKLAANLGAVEVECLELNASLGGNMSVSLGIDEDLLPFGDWLINVTSICQSSKTGFLSASSTFNGNFSATIKPSAPFDFIDPALFKGSFSEPYEIEFCAERSNSQKLPAIDLSVDFPGIGGIKRLSCANVTELLSRSLEFLVGDGDVETCSGGMLGKKPFTYRIPVLGISACSSAHFLQVLVDAVHELEMSSKVDSSTCTFSTLRTKLETLLIDGIGTPRVYIASTSMGDQSEFLLQLELAWSYNATTSLDIDMADLYSTGGDIGSFLTAFVPSEGDATLMFESGLKLQLDVGAEYSSMTNNASYFILGTTGLSTTFSANGNADFDASIGIFRGHVNAQVSAGHPVALTARLLNETQKYYLAGTPSDPHGVLGILENLDVSVEGKVDSKIHAALPLGSTLDLNISIDLDGPTIEILYQKYEPPTQAVSPPDLLELLLADPDALVDALDNALMSIEAGTFGPKGIVTNFDVPFIKRGVARALGARTDNNVVAQTRRKIVPRLRERLNGFDQPADTVAEALGELLEDILQSDAVNLIQENEDVSVDCFRENSPTNCTDKSDSGRPTSVMWTIPLSQHLLVDLPLDFSLGEDFPLKISLDSGAELDICWRFDFAFGFDSTEGFFIYTFPEKDRSEFAIEALLSVPDTNIDASLFFLSAGMNNLNLDVGAAIFLDMNKASALGMDKPGPMHGRLSRGDFRRITKPGNLFDICSGAGAKLHVPSATLEVKAEKDIGKWIPHLSLELAAHFRKEAPEGCLVSIEDHASVGRLHDGSSHRALALLRSLASCDSSDDLKKIFDFTGCSNDFNTKSCAVIKNVALDVTKLGDMVEPILEKLANSRTGGGYLDKVIEPLLELNKPLDGVKQIVGRDLTVLDVAEEFVGPKSGAGTVRKILEIYDEIDELLAAFDSLLSEDGLVLAHSCSFIGKFKCSGGLYELTSKRDDNGTLPTSAVSTVTTPFPQKSLVAKLENLAGSIPGLDISVLRDPASILNLLLGQDIDLLRYKPPEVTFAFEYGLQFILYTPPTVKLGISFEFTAALKAEFVLDTKGIREAIEQKRVDKALNSIGLQDTFNGVDEPLLALTASVMADLSASIGFVRVGVSGGITFLATIDFFDPYPKQSRGIVRPYQLLSLGATPLKWFEFSLQINLSLRVYIQVRIRILWKRITIWEWDASFSRELLPRLIITPKLPGKVASFVATTGVLTLDSQEDGILECTSLSGSIGEEVIECVSGVTFNSFSNVKEIGSPSSASPGALDRVLNGAVGKVSGKDVVLRGIQSKANFDFLINKLTLDYFDTGITMLESIVIGTTEVLAGLSVVAFQDELLTSGVIVLPRPEEDFLMTTLKNCNKEWILKGHTNLKILANEVDAGCKIVAPGGNYTTAQLIIDFGFDKDVDCSAPNDGSRLVLTTDPADETSHQAVIVAAGMTSNVTVKIGAKFTDIQIKMTNCNDEVIIESSPRKEGSRDGSISIYGGGGDDVIIIGSIETGLTKVSKTVIIDGGPGKDKLIVDNSGSQANGENGKLYSGSLHGLPANLDFSNFEKVEINLSSGTNIFEVISTAPGSNTSVRAGPKSDQIFVRDTQGDITVDGGDGDDAIWFCGLREGVVATVYGGAGNDTLWANRTDCSTDMQTNPFNASRLRWSGQEGSDTLHAYFTSIGSSDVDIFNDNDGINSITIDCSENVANAILCQDNRIATIQDNLDQSSSMERITLFKDMTANGVQDPGEPGIEGVDIVITTSAGERLTLLTDESGMYMAEVPVGPTNVKILESSLPPGATHVAGTDPTILVVPAGGTVTKSNGYCFPAMDSTRLSKKSPMQSTATKSPTRAATSTGKIKGIVFVDFNSICETTEPVYMVTLRLKGGENKVYFDDTFAVMDVFGGPDKDEFHIGQLHNIPGDASHLPVHTLDKGMQYLSNGNSHFIIIDGNAGDDVFDILHNKEILTLNGDLGDDYFRFESFVGLESPDDKAQPDYVMNSMVNIDGGAGYDSLIVGGTHGNDSYIMSDVHLSGGRLSGGGLDIVFRNLDVFNEDDFISQHEDDVIVDVP